MSQLVDLGLEILDLTEWPALEKIWKILEVPGTFSNTWNYLENVDFLRIYLEISGRNFFRKTLFCIAELIKVFSLPC